MAKNNLKRFGALFLALVMIITFLPPNLVQAADTYDNHETFYDYTYTGSSYQNNLKLKSNETGVTWILNGVREAQKSGYEIDGNGILLGDNRKNPSITTTVNNGIGDIEVSLRKAFTDGSERNYGLYIAGDLVDFVEVPNSGKENSEVVYLKATVNKPGKVKVEIKPTENKVGQVTVDNIKWTNFSGTSNPPTPSGEMTIAEARDAAHGDEVTTTGVVTFVDNNNIVIQDDTAGINIYKNRNTVDVQVGQEVKVTGSRGAYNGLEQISISNTADVEVLNSGATKELPTPQTISLATLISNPEEYESERIYIANLTVESNNSYGDHILTDGTNTIQIYKPFTKANVGDDVNVTAIVSDHNGVQLRTNSQSNIEIIGGGGGELTPPTDAIKVQETRDTAHGEMVKTSGTVTFTDGNNITIQDETGGIVVRTPRWNPPNIGDVIVATGTRAEYKGIEQVNNATYEVLGQTSLPAPKVVTLEELADPAVAESYESERIRLENVFLRQINTDGNTPVHDGKGNEMQAYKIPKLSGIDDYDKVNIDAVMGQYNTNYQLRIAQASDVTLVEALDLAEYKDDLTNIEDPISPELEDEIKAAYPGALNVKEAAINKNYDTEITVFGVATHTYSGGSAIIIQDIVDGEIWGYQIYGPPETVQAGDIVVARGKHVDWYTTPEMSGVQAMKRYGDPVKPMEAQVITVETLKNYPEKFVNEYIYVKDAILPEYNGDGEIFFETPTGTLQTYRAPEYPIGSKAGDTVDVRGSISLYNGTPQIRLQDYQDYIITNDTLAPFIIANNPLDAKATIDYTMTVGAIDNVGVKSVTMEVTINGETFELPMEMDPVTENFTGTIPGEKIIGDGNIEVVFKSVDVNGNKNDKFYLGEFSYPESSPHNGPLEIKIDNRPQVVSVNPKANDETLENKTPTIEVEFSNAGANPTVDLYLNESTDPIKMTVAGNKATYKATSPMEDGKVNAKVVITNNETKSQSEDYEWSFYIGEATVRHYYGQIHSHSNYSDGAGTPAEAVKHAAQAEQIDFFALTDHSNYFDNASNLGTFEDSHSGIADPNDPSRPKWVVYKETIEAARTDDFLPIYGYEMTWTKSGANYGHINTFNTDGFVSRNDPYYNDKSESKGLLRYYDKLVEVNKTQDNVINQWNHPGSTFGTFDDFAHYSPEYDEVMHLVEVGNGEGPVGGKGYFRSYEYYTMALDKGWHVAPSNNQDNHRGNWGDSNTTRTVVIADSLDKASLANAIKARQVYATEDNNLAIDYTVNNQPMGSQITGDTTRLKFNVNINDSDPSEVIGKVSVISNGGNEVYNESVNSNVGTLNFEIPNTGTYYYLRIDQADGDIAVTAPVWTGSIEQTGIDNVTKASDIEYLNEDVELTTTFVNTGDSDINLEKVEYYQVAGDKEELLTTQTEGLPVIKASGRTELKGTVQPTKTGPVTIRVKAYPSGSDKAWAGEINLSVYDRSAKVTPIAEVQAADEGQAFTVEARLTSNASGFDVYTAFFDSAYIQDETGGINIFPISGNYQEGQKLRLYGTTSSYQGEHQLNVDKIELIDAKPEKIAPKKMSIADTKTNIGLLVTVEGKVVENNGEDGIVIDDGTGKTIVFIDGYIGRANSDNKDMDEAKVGDTLIATGLSSINPLGNRIRIRNRDDVDVIKDPDAPVKTEAEDFIATVRTERVKQGEKVDLTDNITNLPKGAKVEDISSPAIDTSKIGEQKGRVKITFADGSSEEVEIKVVIEEPDKTDEDKTVDPPKEDPKDDPKKDDTSTDTPNKGNDNDKKDDKKKPSRRDDNKTTESKGTDTGKIENTGDDGKTESPSPESPDQTAGFEPILDGESFEEAFDKFEAERLSGPSRFATAVEISKKAYDESDTVILSSGTVLADALTASSLAASLDAPILLVDANNIPEETLAEIERLGASKVIIAGGNGTVSNEVMDALMGQGLEVTRIAGPSRYTTAIEIGEEIRKYSDNQTDLVLANGNNLVDALASTNIGAKEEIPVLLTPADGLHEETKKAIEDWDIENIIIAGGSASISQEVEDELKAMGINVTRLAGSDRYETAVELAKQAYPEADEIIVANGTKFSDALVGGILTTKLDAPLLLIEEENIPQSVVDYINTREIEKITILGGNASISELAD